jgi:uncharacterized membrane protein required for colicin V production
MMTAVTPSLSFDNLPLGWFDFVFVAVLLFGLYRGRKNGMTKEFVPMFRWIAVMVAATLGYEFAGQIFHNFTPVGQAGSNVLGYLTVAFIVFLVFIPIDSFLTPRLTGSNFFGGTEYYLGILAGFIRYLCLIFFALALMNAPHYTAAEIQAQKDYAFQTFGGGQQGFSGNFFPTFQQVQEGVFKKSLVGPFIADHLGVMLIHSVPVAGQKTPAKTPVIHM